jgi:O-methyltransferase involved in polyketide biosynthesis
MAELGSARISPTAHYTGFVWFKNGLSHPAFMTREGRLLHGILRPMNIAYELRGRAGLDAMLLARHRAIDGLLRTAVAEGRVGQVVEVAAGLSPRGYRFTREFPELTYVEGDLPGMVARKRDILARAGAGSDRHHVVEIDALADAGPRSLTEVAGGLLDPARGTALITEGLLGYFPIEAVHGMWERFAAFLGRFPHGLYLSDLHTRSTLRGVRAAGLFRKALSMFARGEVHLHFAGADDAEQALLAAGFSTPRVFDPEDPPGVVHIVDAVV